MGLRDLRLVRADECAAADDVLATDHEPVDAMWAGKDERGDEILGAAELEAVCSPDGEVGALPRRERADVGATQHRCSATGAEPQRLARGHRVRATAASRHKERLLDLQEQIAPLVRRRAVDAETDAHARVDEILDRRDTRPEAQIRGWAMRDARARCGELRDFAGGQVDAMSAPDVAGEPAESLQVLDRRAAVLLLAVGALLGGLS